MFKVIRMGLEHLDAVHGIETRSFAIPWSKKSIRDDLTGNKHAIYLIAVNTDVNAGSATAARESALGVSAINEAGAEAPFTVAGYAGMWHVVNEGHINNIAVDEPYRRMGAGSLLMDALVNEALRLEMIGLTLEVRVGNRAAMALYHKYGFKVEGLRKNYYSDTKEDAAIMWKYI